LTVICLLAAGVTVVQAQYPCDMYCDSMRANCATQYSSLWASNYTRCLVSSLLLLPCSHRLPAVDLQHVPGLLRSRAVVHRSHLCGPTKHQGLQNQRCRQQPRVWRLVFEAAVPLPLTNTRFAATYGPQNCNAASPDGHNLCGSFCPNDQSTLSRAHTRGSAGTFCDQYCNMMVYACTGANQQYASLSQCQTVSCCLVGLLLVCPDDGVRVSRSAPPRSRNSHRSTSLW
jgi:hypothetical protein